MGGVGSGERTSFYINCKNYNLSFIFGCFQDWGRHLKLELLINADVYQVL